MSTGDREEKVNNCVRARI